MESRVRADHAGQVRTASGINTVLGLWLIASPWVYGYAGVNVGSVWNSVIVGVVIAIFGALRYRSPHQGTTMSWINLVLGVWTAISPWIYGYVENGGRLWNSLIVGIVIAVLAIWSGSATASERRQVPA